MTNDEGSPNVQMTKQGLERALRHSDFDIRSSLVIRHYDRALLQPIAG